MAATRVLFLILMVSCAVLFLLYAATGQARFKKWGLWLLQGTLFAGFLFFGVLIYQRFSV